MQLFLNELTLIVLWAVEIIFMVVLVFRMATAAYQVVGAIQSGGCISHSSFHQESRNTASLKLISKGFKVDIALGTRGSHCLKKRSLSVIQATASQTAMFDVISSPSSTTTNDSKKKTSMRLYCEF